MAIFPFHRVWKTTPNADVIFYTLMQQSCAAASCQLDQCVCRCCGGGCLCLETCLVGKEKPETFWLIWGTVVPAEWLFWSWFLSTDLENIGKELSPMLSTPPGSPCCTLGWAQTFTFLPKHSENISLLVLSDIILSGQSCPFDGFCFDA